MLLLASAPDTAVPSEEQFRLAIRRHHLIEEAKVELDLAYEEVKRAEQAVMALEFEYNERMHQTSAHMMAELIAEKEGKQEAHNLDALYEMQNEAAQRFALVSAAFAIVSSVQDEDMSLDLIKRILFRRDFLRRHKLEVDKHIRSFHRGLREYMRKESSPEADQAVRASWSEIERMTSLQAKEAKAA
ncbi:MAG: hypothetical protein HYU58_04840 [Proteobacteria bacterium]|nr:hypothetical protein [Pseudomonadota bacterium]